MHQAMQEEYRWLEHTEAVLVNDNLQEDETVSWAAHHASLQLPNTTPDGCVMITSLLPGNQSSDIPGNWAEFLRINDNKTELFSFLATSVASLDHDKQIITTHHTKVICNYSRDVTGIAPCTHEEADTRILLHVKDAVNEGYTTVSIRTVDTDVLVLAVTAAHCLNITELWVGFGTGKSYRYLAAHEMASALGPDRCIALPMFHAFTGCDTVPSFCGRGKKTAWSIWATFNEVTRAFCALAPTPNTMDDWIDSIKSFVVLLFDRTSSLESVNLARKQLFTQKGRDISGLPPKHAALLQHTKRAVYQTAHCWRQMMVAVPPFLPKSRPSVF